MRKSSIEFEQVIERGCGLDVHRDTVVATVMGKGIKTETRTFGTTTSSLKELGDWLESMRVTDGAMESTGIYWKPVLHILREYPINIMVVNARHIKNVPGRKTDKADSQWICKLLISGLLKGSFIPPENIQELRNLHRYKKKLIGTIASEKNRIIRILEDANIKLSSVVSDTSGVTANYLIKGLIEGRKDLDNLISECYHKKLQASPQQIKEAITGRLTAHHAFILKSMQKHIASLEAQIAEIDVEIEKYIKDFEKEIELLQTIPGVRKEGAIGIVAEIGVDMDVFPSEHHLASHSGMCPGNNESAGKKKSSRTRQGNKHLKATLTELAWGATRTKKSYYKAKYESMVGRRGKKRALIAIGHKILCASYHIIKNKEAFKELGYEYLAQRKNKNRLEYLKRELKEHGYIIEKAA
ncbi:MAG: IS110 family transposase [Bacteroidales bacterium]|jgi:transposase